MATNGQTHLDWPFRIIWISSGPFRTLTSLPCLDILVQKGPFLGLPQRWTVFSKKPLFVTKTFSFRENLHFDNLKRVCTIFGINRDREAVSGCSKTIWRRLALKRALDFERSIGSEVKQTGPHPILEILQGFPSHSVWQTHLRVSKRLLRHSISRAYGRPKTSNCAQF